MALLPLGITADDLTGAADAAAALARPGASVPVSLDAEPRSQAGATAFAVTTESRGCAPAESYALVRASVLALQRAGAALVLKKVDSNLRGSVGAEVAAVADATGGPVWLAPAFPARGRTTIGGIALVGGRPVAETEMARDPEAPVAHSRIAGLLAATAPELPVGQCHLNTVRAGAQVIAAAAPEQGVLVLDAEQDDDLDEVVAAALSLPHPPALAGSAGLAAALARRLLGPSARRDWPEGRGRPVLGVLASASAALPAQVARAGAEPDLRPIALQCEGLSRDEEDLPELRRAMELALAELAAGRHALVHAVGPLPAVPHPVELVVEHLAHLAFVVAEVGRPAGLLVGGGATAHAVLSALGAEAVLVDEEPLAGIAAGRVSGGRLAGSPVVLKPGAAGAEGALVELLGYLCRRAAAEPAT